MTTTTVDVIAQRLYMAGCHHAFGIPGGEVLAMMEALDRAGITFTLTKHENAAGFMAEGTHHANGAPGILLATVGPGIANAVNVIANAQQDRVPLIVLSGCIDPADQLTFTHQVFNHIKLMEPITKACFTAVKNASDVMVDKALTIATDGRPGPVYIDIPIDVATAEHMSTRGIIRTPGGATTPSPSPQLEEARQKLSSCRRPIMIAGLDVLYDDGATKAVREFVQHFNIPLLERADLILSIGYDPIEMRAGWINPWDPAKVIEVALVENTHYVHQADLSFTCSITQGLHTLQEGLEPRSETWPDQELTDVRAQLKAEFRFEEDWGPAVVIETARRLMPTNTIATADTGAHRILLSQMWTCHEPRTLLQSTGLCTMGCALPLAMGYKLARSEVPVIAFTGDAGMEMVLGELATLRDLSLPIIIVVFVDCSLALIELKQRGTGRNNLGVDFGSTDFAKLAQAMGGEGVVASSTSELKHHFKSALKRDGFTLIATPIGRKAYDEKL